MYRFSFVCLQVGIYVALKWFFCILSRFTLDLFLGSLPGKVFSPGFSDVAHGLIAGGFT